MQTVLGFLEDISFQKLVGNLDKMIVANLGRQNHRSLGHTKEGEQYSGS